MRKGKTMQPHTSAAIVAILKSDPTVTPAERRRFMRMSKGEQVETEQIIRPLEAARRLGMSRRTLSNLIADGTLPAVRLPGLNRVHGIRESDLSALMASRRGA